MIFFWIVTHTKTPQWNQIFFVVEFHRFMYINVHFINDFTKYFLIFFFKRLSCEICFRKLMQIGFQKVSGPIVHTLGQV